MAAAGTDSFRKKANNFSTTLASAMLSTDTGASLNAVTGLPTDTAVDLVIDRVDGNGNQTPTKREYVKGIVSGSTITAMTRGLGNSTAQAHATSAVVEMVDTSDTHNDMVTALLNVHNQIDGSLKNGAVTNASIASGAVDATKLASGAVTSASILDGTIAYADLLSTIFSGQVQSYTNTGSGNGTFNYVNIGGVKLLWGQFSAGSTSGNGLLNFLLNYPSSFFTSTPQVFPVINLPTSTSQWIVYTTNITSSLTQIAAQLNVAGASTIAPAVFVIGT